MQRTTPSSCQVPLALAILLLVAGALFCFAGAFALGVGAYYFLQSSEIGQVVVATPTPLATPTPRVSITPFTSSSPSVTPFRSTTPFKADTPSAKLDENGFRTAQIQIGTETLDV